MIRNISVGIDVGSSTTRVVVGEFSKGEKNPKIIGVGEAPALGLRHGYVVNESLAEVSIKNAIGLAEKSSGIKIKRAFVSLSGITLHSEVGTGGTIISGKGFLVVYRKGIGESCTSHYFELNDTGDTVNFYNSSGSNRLVN